MRFGYQEEVACSRVDHQRLRVWHISSRIGEVEAFNIAESAPLRLLPTFRIELYLQLDR